MYIYNQSSNYNKFTNRNPFSKLFLTKTKITLDFLQIKNNDENYEYLTYDIIDIY